jgi:predicted enzyme related to lactoylglutathione lyase
VLKAGERGIGGLMTIPEDAVRMGMRPNWVGYIFSADVDETTRSIAAAGGKVYRQPADIPSVGRFSVVTDPQGAMFMLIAPEGEDQPKVAPGTEGHVGWRELYANDWTSAFDFYAATFGWTKGEAMDMGPMGVYQLFEVDGEQTGGMMNKPAAIPHPMWLFYFNVGDIDAAAGRVGSAGGQVLNGPMEVPGGSWIVQCADPQGAMFALAGKRG